MSNWRSHDKADMYSKDGLPVYGMDKELKMKQDAKRDVALENVVRAWVEEVTGMKFPSSDFQESLKSGVILCALANKLKPGSIKKVNKNNMPFMQMENINYFLKVVDQLGVKKHDSFMTVDLYEAKNIPQVVQSLSILGSVAQRIPTYNGPTIGVKMAEKKEINFTEDQLRKSRNTISQQNAGSIAHKSGRSIGNEVVKVQNVGDTRVTSQQNGGSIAYKSSRSIGNEVVKVQNVGDTRVTSQQNGGSIAHKQGKSISNEIVRGQSKPSSKPSSGGGSLDDLEKLASLRDKGIISDQEFQQKKKQILGL